MVLRVTPEKREEKGRIRSDLQRAALRLGAAHGFASLGLREVAREAQIAPTSFYRHFEHMEALGLSVVRDMVEPLLRKWVAAFDPTGDEHTALLDAVFRSVDDDPELARFLVAERVGSSRVLRDALREALDALGQPLLRGSAVDKRSRSLLDAADLATVFTLEAAAGLLDCSSDGRAALRHRSLQRLMTAVVAVRSAGPKP